MALLVMTSFGSGFVFLACLKTSMLMDKTGGGWALGLVSMSMSLSLSIAVASVNIYGDRCPKTTPDCWRNYARLFSVESAIAFTLGFASLFLFNTKNYPWLGQANSQDTKLTSYVGEAELPQTETGPDKKIGVLRTLTLWTHPYFYAMLIAYFAAVGSSVSVLSTSHNVFLNYVKGTLCPVIHPSSSCQFSGFIETIGTGFSYANASANVVGAISVGFFVERKILSARQMYMITLVLMFVDYVIIGTLYVIEARTYETMIVLVACMISMGIGFRIYFEFGPLLRSENLKGTLFFSKFFSFFFFSIIYQPPSGDEKKSLKNFLKKGFFFSIFFWLFFFFFGHKKCAQKLSSLFF